MAFFVALLMFPSFAGCMGSSEPEPYASDLQIVPEILTGAQFQFVEFTAKRSMSVHVPYFVMDGETGLVANGTTLQFNAKGSQTLQMLSPSNLPSAYFMIGDVGQESWNLRATNQSWAEWFNSSEYGSTYEYLEHPVYRNPQSGVSPDEGANHSTGLVDGYSYTLEEVGRIFQMTRERIRQIECKAMNKLQQPFRSKKLKSFLD